ncbi:MAG TPA: hypothetical protein VKN74_07860 [Candidatus Mcinerneyibacterium sp.]|nr:hypothetical protein [Candidatus Mcinerneyibacterium sp.]
MKELKKKELMEVNGGSEVKACIVQGKAIGYATIQGGQVILTTIGGGEKTITKAEYDRDYAWMYE